VRGHFVLPVGAGMTIVKAETNAVLEFGGGSGGSTVSSSDKDSDSLHGINVATN